MSNAKKLQWGLGAAALIIVFFLIKTAVGLDRMARIGAGYKAKILCSEVFVANRAPGDVLATDFANIDPLMDLISAHVDEKQKRARASTHGLGRATAIYREGYGCTLANGGRVTPLPPATPSNAADPWPEAPPVSGKALPWVDYGAIDFALTSAFENDSTNNRSVLVIVDGKIIGEHYADGFGPNTPFLSWSMGKSVISTLIGAAAQKGLIDITAPVEEWANDPERSKITWRDLLQMQSGLEFIEEYTDLRSDVNRMLFESADAGAAAASKPQITPAGSRWYYSSGTSNLLSRTLRDTLDQAGLNYHSFAQEVVFEPVGATSMVMEPDASGTFIGSSFVYGTARDWARLGQLYLQDGVWNGRRILPENWNEFVAEPASESDNQYGAHFWLNRDGINGRERYFPGLPEEVYFMAGHEGQYVFIIPSKNMIVVRTGMTRHQKTMEAFRPTLEALYLAVGNAPDSNSFAD